MAYDRVIRWLAEQGATIIAPLPRKGRSRHPRLRFHWRGEEWTIVVSGSPSSSWKAERAAVTELKGLLGLVGGEKTVGERRERRRRKRREAAAFNDPAAQSFRKFVPRGAIATLGDVWPGDVWPLRREPEVPA
jgi:hypothetical protein